MRPPVKPTETIPGIPAASQAQLEHLFAAQPSLQTAWLFGSRAMGRYQPGSDIDLCLEGQLFSHQDRLRLMVAIDDLLLPWKVDLVLRHEMPPELLAHLDRVGLCIWRQRAPL
jgi:predicted nucleotidyltransferase